jgi:hypothetical protein
MHDDHFHSIFFLPFDQVWWENLPHAFHFLCMGLGVLHGIPDGSSIEAGALVDRGGLESTSCMTNGPSHFGDSFLVG